MKFNKIIFICLTFLLFYPNTDSEERISDLVNLVDNLHIILKNSVQKYFKVGLYCLLFY